MQPFDRLALCRLGQRVTLVPLGEMLHANPSAIGLIAGQSPSFLFQILAIGQSTLSSFDQSTITSVSTAPWFISVQELTGAIPSLLELLETCFTKLRPLA